MSYEMYPRAVSEKVSVYKKSIISDVSEQGRGEQDKTTQEQHARENMIHTPKVKRKVSRRAEVEPSKLQLWCTFIWILCITPQETPSHSGQVRVGRYK